MSWKLLILVSAFLLVHPSGGQESQISENIVPSGTTVAPQQKSIADWFTALVDLGTETSDREIPEDCPICQCGLGSPRSRIVGGQETKELEFPWMAALTYGGQHFCGGSLINDLYVLTAGHCTEGYSKEEISVRFLEHDWSKLNETKTIDRKVSAIIRHPRFNLRTYINDIALLKLDQRVDLSNAPNRVNPTGEGSSSARCSEERNAVAIRPVCLPSRRLSFYGYNAVAIGWGHTKENGPLSDTLQKVNVTIISNEECRKTDYKDEITDSMLCAGVPKGGQDSCEGDSGGPLHIFSTATDQYQVVGIVSWGEGCARPEYPGVYTRVNRYLNWIKSNTKGACTCQ